MRRGEGIREGGSEGNISGGVQMNTSNSLNRLTYNTILDNGGGGAGHEIYDRD